MTIHYEECPAFPVRFFKFRAPKNLTDETLEKIKKIEFHALNEPAGVGTSYELQNNEEFLPIHKNERYHCDRLVVNKSWANRSDAETGHRHDFHRHPMSYLSGIFYLCLLYTSPSPRDLSTSRMPSSA